MISVLSSNIRAIGYDAAESMMDVAFTSGDTYRYFNVPEHIYTTFLHASSHGQFMNDYIRYNYRYQKVG